MMSPAFGSDRGDAVEGRSDPGKGSLEIFGEPQHIKAVGSDVMGCRAEGHQPEEGEGVLKNRTVGMVKAMQARDVPMRSCIRTIQ